MERLIKGIIEWLMKAVVIMAVLAIFIQGMAGVYRIGNQPWKKHILAWVFFIVGCLVLDGVGFLVFDGVGEIGPLFSLLISISFSSRILVYLFDKYYNFRIQDNGLNSEKESKEWTFGMITSLLVVAFIIVGLLVWDGIDPFESEGLELTFKSILGYTLLTLGFGLPFLGLVFRLVLSEVEISEGNPTS
jgi:hypothetical protein